MKLHILGASGSGVTTLGQALAKKLNLAYFDSDDYFWLKSGLPFTQKRNPAERNQLILEDLSKNANWILGGSVINWGDNLFPKFDLVVFLYLPQNIRIDGLQKREYERYGDSIYTDAQRRKLYNDFIAWAKDYDENLGIANRTLQAHKSWLANSKSPVLEIYGDLTTEERMQLITGKLQQ